MAKNIEKDQSDAAQLLHAGILQIAEENRKIIDHADDYRERWQTAFPDGMLLKLCQEFECCPTIVFIALESIDFYNFPDYKETISIPVCATDKDGQTMIFESRAEAGKVLDIRSNKISESVESNKEYAGYIWTNVLENIYEKIDRIQTYMISLTGIYKIENTITSSCYVGQTQASFRKRWNEHIKKYHSRTVPLYQAFREYSLECFRFSIVEFMIDVSKQEILRREKYYIEKFHSQCENGGMNFDKPKWNKKLEQEIEEQIFDAIIQGKTNSEIIRDYNVSPTLCSLIRSGKRHKREGIQYPILSDSDKKQNEKYLSAYWLLLSSTLSFKEISDKTKLHPGSVRNIYYKKLPSRIAETYPFMVEAEFPKRKKLKRGEYKRSASNKTIYKRCCPTCSCSFETESRNRKYCSKECEVLSRRKFERPSRDEIKQGIRQHQMKEYAESLGISDNALRKWCRDYDLPYNKKEITQFTDEEWEAEIWLNENYADRMKEITWHISPNYTAVLYKFLQFRSFEAVRNALGVTFPQIEYSIEKENLKGYICSVGYLSTCCKLEEESTAQTYYFRSGIDAATWVFNNFPRDAIPASNSKSLSTRIGDFFRQDSPIATLSLPDPSTGSPATLTFTHIPEEEFYSIIQHHHVVSYAFDPKWRAIVEDSSLLPDFVSLDDLPWVEEFKKFYGMD